MIYFIYLSEDRRKFTIIYSVEEGNSRVESKDWKLVADATFPVAMKSTSKISALGGGGGLVGVLR